MQVRCKFLCTSVRPLQEDGKQIEATFLAQWHPETPADQRFTKETPTGTLTVQFNNPRIVPLIHEGKFYFLDISPVD